MLIKLFRIIVNVSQRVVGSKSHNIAFMKMSDSSNELHYNIKNEIDTNDKTN